MTTKRAGVRGKAGKVVHAWAIPYEIFRYPRDPATKELVKMRCIDYANFQFAPWFKPTKKYVRVEIRELPRRKAGKRGEKR